MKEKEINNFLFPFKSDSIQRKWSYELSLIILSFVIKWHNVCNQTFG